MSCTSRPSRWPMPCGKKIAAAPRSRRPSTSPRKMPSARSPSTMEAVDLAAEDAERAQPLDDAALGDLVKLAVATARTCGVDGGELRLQHHVVDGALGRRVATAHRP